MRFRRLVFLAVPLLVAALSSACWQEPPADPTDPVPGDGLPFPTPDPSGSPRVMVNR